MLRPWVNWHPCWCCDKNPKIHLNYFQILQISHAKTKSGFLSSNLTFLGFNMATERNHLQWWRYQLGCWLTLAVRKSSQLHCLESEKSLREKSVLPQLCTGFEGKKPRKFYEIISSWTMGTYGCKWVAHGNYSWARMLTSQKIK